MKTMPQRFNPSAPAGRNPNGPGTAPAASLRLGRLKAAIWENSADQRVFYNVRFSRTYMDEEKKFHDADSFGRDDLLLLAKLADQAHTFICERQSAQKAEE